MKSIIKTAAVAVLSVGMIIGATNVASAKGSKVTKTVQLVEGLMVETKEVSETMVKLTAKNAKGKAVASAVVFSEAGAWKMALAEGERYGVAKSYANKAEAIKAGLAAVVAE